MTRGLADTSFFVALETSRPITDARVPDELGVSVVTIGELRAGVLVATDVETRDRRLSTLLVALSMSPLPVDERVAEAWARLRIALRDADQRMDVNDSWIAATALAHGLPVVTQDDGFLPVAGLEVLRV